MRYRVTPYRVYKGARAVVRGRAIRRAKNVAVTRIALDAVLRNTQQRRRR